MRLQTKELLVFDDPLALSPCHFCAIPTTCWCADWRLLLRAPKEGLALLTLALALALALALTLALAQTGGDEEEAEHARLDDALQLGDVRLEQRARDREHVVHHLG